MSSFADAGDFDVDDVGASSSDEDRLADIETYLATTSSHNVDAIEIDETPLTSHDIEAMDKFYAYLERDEDGDDASDGSSDVDDIEVIEPAITAEDIMVMDAYADSLVVDVGA